MPHQAWSHAVHHWHLPRRQAPPLPGLPRLRLESRRLASLRRGLIVALTALLAGGLATRLQGAARGPHAPAPITTATRA